MAADKTYFIADVHLSLGPDPKKKLVLSFLDKLIDEKADLYILGDFFDFWANNTIMLKTHSEVLSKLKMLAGIGAKVFLLTGNRDFLLTQKTLARFGIDLLGEEAEITVDHCNILIAHGHTLCLSDIKFLKYKERTWPLFKFLDRLLPGFMENYIARKFILKSKEVIQSQDPERFQITRALLEQHLDRGKDAIICGHVHRQETFIINGKPVYSLPAWEDHKGNCLIFKNGKFTFNFFSE